VRVADVCLPADDAVLIAALARALVKTEADRSAPQQVLLLLLAQLAVIPQFGEGLLFDRMPAATARPALSRRRLDRARRGSRRA
jgi:hypothetical protein